MAAHPQAVRLGARAEPLPLASESAGAGAVVVPFVLHHVDDLAAAVHEITLVLRPGGRRLVAGSVAGCLHPRPHHRHLPGSRHAETLMFSPPRWARRANEQAGLRSMATDEVEDAADLRTRHARLSHRAASSPVPPPEAEITAGVRATARDAHESDRPMRPVQDLTTFARRTAAGKG